MTTMIRNVPQAAAKKTMRGVIFTVLMSGQRHKHENDLKRLGFDVESRDFPKTYNLNAYDVVFIVKDHAANNEYESAERAAKLSGKPWFRLTKKTSNPTWEAVAASAKRWGLTPVEDVDSHEPSLAVKPFAALAGGFAEFVERRQDASDWEALATEYEQQALTCAAQTKEALARAEEIETLWKQSEADLKEMRKRLQTAAEDANTTAAQREALRGEVERLTRELTSLKDAKAIGRKAVAAVADEGVMRRLADTDALLRQARVERDETKTALAAAKAEATAAKKAVAGLQDTIDELTKKLAARNDALAAASTSAAFALPVGKRLVPANIEQTAEKLWSLWEDGVMDIEEVWAKLMAQLKGDGS